jgi:uncharacterized protein
VRHGQRNFDSRRICRIGGSRFLHIGLSDEEKSASLNRNLQFWWEGPRMSPKSRHVYVYNKTRETFLAFRVKVADSLLGRLVGLLGRRSLQPDSGVWIVPANAIHTIGMLFSFDLVLIDKDFKVVGLRELVRPFRVTWPQRHAESVLELPAHTIFRSRTQIGDQLLIERYEARKVPQTGESVVGSLPQVAAASGVAGKGSAVPIAPQSSGAELRRSGLTASKMH